MLVYFTWCFLFIIIVLPRIVDHVFFIKWRSSEFDAGWQIRNVLIFRRRKSKKISETAQKYICTHRNLDFYMLSTKPCLLLSHKAPMSVFHLFWCIRKQCFAWSPLTYRAKSCYGITVWHKSLHLFQINSGYYHPSQLTFKRNFLWSRFNVSDVAMKNARQICTRDSHFETIQYAYWPFNSSIVVMKTIMSFCSWTFSQQGDFLCTCVEITN